MKYNGKYKIISRTELTEDVFQYTVSCPEIAAEAAPGQFVHIGVDGFSLRRPISICRIDKQKGELVLVVEARGAGTKKLVSVKEGEEFDIIGPLGTGFTLLPPENTRAVVVGGGIGTPPMLAIADHYKDSCTAILGFRSGKNVVLDMDFAVNCETVVCTDDGSFGVKGNISPALEAVLQGVRPDIVYACGPYVMLRAVRDMCAMYGVKCEISLEERMACGVGACLGCAVRINRDGKEQVLRVCKDGPVFDSLEVIME